MFEWLAFIWLFVIIVFSFIGQGIISFLIVRLVHQKWFQSPDTKDLQIVFLQEQIADLTAERNRIANEKDILFGKCIDLAKAVA